MATDGGEVYLPFDIIIEILKRLPVKSIIRFKSVCKDWKNLLNTPYFIAEHSRCSTHNKPLLLLQELGSGFDLSRFCVLDSKMDVLRVQNPPMIDSLQPCISIIGSSNGLLCVRSGPSLFLWNPAIRDAREVPFRSDWNGPWDLGFGFSPIANDYKIVRIRTFHLCKANAVTCWNKFGTNRVEVYSLSKGSWKEIEFENMQRVRLRSEPAIANGAIFWLGLQMGMSDDEMGVRDDEVNRDLVVSFDIAKEVFTLIQLPAPLSESGNDRLTVYENKLAMLSKVVIENSESPAFDLWVMEESWSWTRKYTIGPISGFSVSHRIWRNQIVGHVREEIAGRRYGRARVKLVLSLFNPTSIELKKFPTRGYYIGFNYTESLVPVGNMKRLPPKFQLLH